MLRRYKRVLISGGDKKLTIIAIDLKFCMREAFKI